MAAGHLFYANRRYGQIHISYLRNRYLESSLLLKVTRFLCYKASQIVGSAFRIEAIVGYTLFGTQLPEGRKVAPQERGNTHHRQEQRAKNCGLHRVTVFVHQYLRLVLKAVLVYKQKHANAKTAADIPTGNNTAVVGEMGLFTVDTV